MDKDITITPAANQEIKKQRGSDEETLRLSIGKKGCCGFDYGLELGTEKRKDDIQLPERDGVSVVVDLDSYTRVGQATIDFKGSSGQGGFVVTNPGTQQCACGNQT